MSLINDALKRAKETQPPPLPKSEPDVPMQPAEQKRPSAWPLVVVPLLLVFVLAVAGWFLFKGATASRGITSSLGETEVTAREATPTSESPTAPTAAPETSSTSPVSKEQAPANKKPKSAQTASAPEKAKGNLAPPDSGQSGGAFPPLKLQGIFYRSLNPSAVINSKTVYVGDRVEHAKVTAIERDSATVEWNGETRVLTME